MLRAFDIPDGTDIIQIRKKINKLFSDARNVSKPETCILCGEKRTSYCNSHSVPQFSLKNIADQGKVLQASALMGMEVIDTEKGVNNSGTFQFICNNCDGTFFQDYENEQNLKVRPTDKILAEIAIKNILLQLSKRAQEKALFRELQRQYNAYSNLEYLEEIKDLDIRDYNEELNLHKDITQNNVNGNYQILFWKVVPYKVPIAVQSAIALLKDMEGNEINNVFDKSDSVRMQFMHLAILPLKNESLILAFYHRRDKLYRKLRHQINSSSEQKILKFLNYIIFAYTENYYISKTIQSTIESDEKLSQLGRESNEYPDFGSLGPDNNFGIGYQPISMDEIPNFLSAEWAVEY